MIRRPPRSTLDRSSAASDVYKRQENSRRISAAIVAYIRAHPSQAAGHALAKLREFLAIPTGYYRWQPDHPGLRLYRWAAWVGLVWLGAQLVAAGVALGPCPYNHLTLPTDDRV